MVTGTYLHLSGIQTNQNPVVVKTMALEQVSESVLKIPQEVSDLIKDSILKESDKANMDATGRKEPAIPEPPLNEDKLVNEREPSIINNKNLNLESSLDSNISKSVFKKLPNDSKVGSKINIKDDNEVKSVSKNISPVLEKIEDSHLNVKVPEIEYNIPVIVPKTEDTLHPDAIKKEDKENAEEVMQQNKPVDNEIENKQEKILKQMEHQQYEQKQLIEEQKKILQELKNQKEKIGEIKIEKHIVANKINDVSSAPISPNNQQQLKLAKDATNLGSKIDEKRFVSPQRDKDFIIKSKVDSADSSKSSISSKKISVTNSSNTPKILTNINSRMQVKLHDQEKFRTENNEVIPQKEIDLQNMELSVSPKHTGEFKKAGASIDKFKQKKVIKSNADLLKSFVLQNRSKIGETKKRIAVPNDRSIPLENIGQEEPAPHDEERRKRDLSDVIQTRSKFISSVNPKLVSSEKDSKINSSTIASKVASLLDSVSTIISAKKVNQPDLLKSFDAKANIAAPALLAQAESQSFIQDGKSKLNYDPIISDIVNSDKLSLSQVSEIPISGLSDVDKFDIESKIKLDLKKIEVDNVVYDTRHLLWSSRSNAKVNLGRRRKKRNKQYPDYWDEM